MDGAGFEEGPGRAGWVAGARQATTKATPRCGSAARATPRPQPLPGGERERVRGRGRARATTTPRIPYPLSLVRDKGTDAVIRFDQVSKRYEGGHEALSQLSFEVAAGEMAFVTGHS